MISKGDRVMTPYGRGDVAAVRLGTVSVVLDRWLDRPGYTGTIFGAVHVMAIPEAEPEPA